jgi:hypothetical protein
MAPSASFSTFPTKKAACRPKQPFPLIASVTYSTYLYYVCNACTLLFASMHHYYFILLFLQVVSLEYSITVLCIVCTSITEVRITCTSTAFKPHVPNPIQHCTMIESFSCAVQYSTKTWTNHNV